MTVYQREGKPIFFPRRSKDVLAASSIELFSQALESREKDLTVAS